MVTRPELSLEHSLHRQKQPSSRDSSVMGNGKSRSANYIGNKNSTEDVAKHIMAEVDYPRRWLPPGSCFHVDLSLVDVSKNINEDPNALQLLKNLQTGIWANACSAETHLKGLEASSPEEATVVRKRVSRFLKTRDKYLAFGSMLLKSQYFHEIYSDNTDSNSDGEKQARSVVLVHLPTTQYRKPYIPLPNGWKQNSNNSAMEEDVFSFSISHQFPFVGCARIKHDNQSSVTKDSNIASQAIRSTVPPPIVGLDIVVFEEINSRLYSSEEEFLQVFQDQFTQNEWENGIQQTSPPNRYREFFVRWAMKEAYTKAIGVGMGLDFKSFEIQLDLSDQENITSSVSSIWTRVCNEHEPAAVLKATELVCFKGTIVFENKKENEYFYFYFLPLISNTTIPDPTEGCACICVGSFRENHPTERSSDDNERWKNSIAISWTSLEELGHSHNVN